MSTFALRKKLVAIAEKDVGRTEVSPNRSPTIARYWPATNYPGGYANREPYCAAAVCYWVRQWLALPDVRKAFDMTAQRLEAWRCKSPLAFGWLEWAKAKGLTILPDDMSQVLHTGDLMVFDMSHIGIVYDDENTIVKTIEANTGPSGGRDGDGIWKKERTRSLARAFIRLLP